MPHKEEAHAVRIATAMCAGRRPAHRLDFKPLDGRSGYEGNSGAASILMVFNGFLVSYDSDKCLQGFNDFVEDLVHCDLLQARRSQLAAPLMGLNQSSST
ncbi:hypothetical protein HPP92_019474 [Vanilla planifolia]|uniref:Uncharacterized protein n=1 Tax=Vanilla planifolia TaxID=51239 RepID=A0A835ULR1_VANPL|nr:hypothetical protein HPP92_027365 [Vanilla planifolia]KAG0465310.1 hypothetical protein HPP92_019474 [Vanilla planifolia]